MTLQIWLVTYKIKLVDEFVFISKLGATEVLGRAASTRALFLVHHATVDDSALVEHDQAGSCLAGVVPGEVHLCKMSVVTT